MAFAAVEVVVDVDPVVVDGGRFGLGWLFAVPVLAYKQGSLVAPFEETIFLDRPWRLRDCDAALTEAEFPSTVTAGQVGEITASWPDAFQRPAAPILVASGAG